MDGFHQGDAKICYIILQANLAGELNAMAVHAARK